LNKLRPKARRRMNRAMARDEIMYGGESFQPGPGHEMFFDFEQFRAFAKAHTNVMMHHFNTHKYRAKKHHSNSSGLTSTQFLTACLEINVCASDVAAPGAGALQASLDQAGKNGTAMDVCGQLGLSGTVTLESSGGKQKMTISAALQLSVSMKAFGAALTVYAGGQADWEFEITPGKTPYGSVYNALYEGIRQMIQTSGGKSTVPKQVLERASLARKMLVDEKKRRQRHCCFANSSNR
jgi:hypothetical protein